MSREERLDRLGLLHLKDDPTALEAELKARIATRDAKEEQERKVLEALRQKQTIRKTPPR